MAMSNEEVIRKGYAAFQAGDMESLRGLLDPNIVWHAAGEGPLAGDYKGVDDVLGTFMKTAELSGGTFKVEIHDLLASDDHVVVLATGSAQREGKSFSGNYSHVTHVENGKLKESWVHYFDQNAADDFWK